MSELAHDEKIIKLPVIDDNKNKIYEMYSKVIQKHSRFQKLHTRAAFLRTINTKTGESTIKPVVVHQLFETSILIDAINESMFTTEVKQIMDDKVPYFISKSTSLNYSSADFDWLEEN